MVIAWSVSSSNGMMLTLLFHVLFWFGTLQSTPESLIDALSSPDIQTRTDAAQKLLQLGKSAVPALRQATVQAEPEVALHAKEILTRIGLREQLSPALRDLDGVELRLAQGGKPAWSAFFLEAVPWKAPSSSPYSRLQGTDLECLVERAVEGAKDEQELNRILEVILYYRLDHCGHLLEGLLKDSRPQIRGLSSRALILCERTDILARAKPLLESGDVIIRGNAIGALGERRVKPAVPMLLALTEDPGVMFNLGSTLLQLGSKQGAPLLLKVVERSEKVSGMGFSQATMILGFYAGPEIIPQMREQLRFMKNDPNTADGALNHLGIWGDRGSIPIIEQAVRDFRIWGNNTSYAPRALYYMGARSSTKTLLKLAEESSGTAMVMIGQMGLRDAIPALRDMLARGRSWVAAALAELGDRDSLPAIRKLLEKPEEDDRARGCSALAMLRDAESLDRLRELPEARRFSWIWPAIGEVPAVDGAALPIQGNLPPETRPTEYAAAISEGTNSTYGFPRYLSVRAAATVRGGRTVEQILPWLGKTGNEYPGLIASAALARMGRKEGIPYLLEADRLLMAFNAVRSPDTWKLLESKTTTLNVYAPYQEIHRALAMEAGLELEGPSKESDAFKAWTDVHQRFHKWGRPPTIAEAFEMLDESRWSIVLEKNRIRVVPHEEALTLWTEWANQAGLPRRSGQPDRR